MIANNIHSNNKRIVKNTLMLYIRMFFTLVIGLYTSRVILNTLGVEDYGVYNVVGGVVSMLTFINVSMAVATQRFLTIELGKNNIEQYSRVFSMCVQIYVILGMLVLVLGETLGVWFVNTQLIIPIERLTAANWVLQTSLAACCISLMIIPFNASIIAYERMNFFAYISIVDSVLKLVIVFCLLWIPYDKLIIYGFLMLAVVLLNIVCYYLYCKLNFAGCKFDYIKDKALCKELLSYSGWNLFGAISIAAQGQGLNILLGMFFGPTVNAARGIAYQISSLANQFFSSFYTAVQPQIIKYYSQKDYDNMNKLILRSSKFSFFLILFVTLPILFQAPYIINIWLGNTPDYVVSFVRIIIFITAIDAMSSPLMTGIQATGRIKTYQITLGIIILLNIPISYYLLSLEFQAVVVFYVSCIISIVALFARLLFAKQLINFSVKQYLVKVIMLAGFVAIASAIFPLLIQIYLFPEQNIVSFLCIGSVILLCITLAIYFIGLSKEERLILMSVFRRLVKKV